MRAKKGKILVRFGNGHGINDKVTLEGGMELFVHGKERPEIWANCIGVVVSSGVDGISDGDTIGCSYQATFDYEWKDDGSISYRNAFVGEDGGLVFTLTDDMVLFKRMANGVDIPFGNWRIMTEIRWGVGDIGVGVKKGCGRCVATGEVLYFEERFRGELYERKYIVLDNSRILFSGEAVAA